jgi:hypothetical protein
LFDIKTVCYVLRVSDIDIVELLVQALALVQEQEQGHILALVLKTVEVLHMVVELAHKLEQVQDMDGLLEPLLAVEQAQHMDVPLVPAPVEE